MESATKIILDGERPASLNKFLRMNKHARNRETNRVKSLMRSQINPERDPYKDKVDIEMVVYFDRNPYDSTNLTIKPYEDGLKDWYLVDDSPKYVRRAVLESRIDRRRPRVEIKLIPVEEEQP